jgi:hypothetical protein
MNGHIQMLLDLDDEQSLRSDIAVLLETVVSISLNPRAHFLVQGVYKLPIGITVLRQVDAGKKISDLQRFQCWSRVGLFFVLGAAVVTCAGSHC